MCIHTAGQMEVHICMHLFTHHSYIFGMKIITSIMNEGKLTILIDMYKALSMLIPRFLNSVNRSHFVTHEIATDWTYRFSHTWRDDTRNLIGWEEQMKENILNRFSASESQYVYMINMVSSHNLFLLYYFRT
jgi:hypothetical protein